MQKHLRVIRFFRLPSICLVGAFCSLVWSHPGLAQDSGQSTGQTNVASTENESEFQLKITSNLVVARVVVRDANGKPVEGLRKEDFEIFDRGKKQAISQFEAGTSTPSPSTSSSASAVVAAQAQSAPPPVAARPGNFLAFYFDDLNTSAKDMLDARNAADRYLAANLQPQDRVAIVTSGQVLTDFTTDPQQIHAALGKLRGAAEAHECPDLSDYQALQIMQENPDYSEAWKMALDEAVGRCKLQASSPGQNLGAGQADSQAAANPQPDKIMSSQADSQLVNMIRGIAQKIVSQVQIRARSNLLQLDHLVGYLSQISGQRTIILVSPGFLSQNEQYDLDRTIDRAVRSQVVISSLDPKGLAPPTEADASRYYLADRSGATERLESQRELAVADVLAELADDTGGVFFHNNNDLKAGLATLTGSSYYYMLAFAPSGLKRDGKFHLLKITLITKHKGCTVQARRGYFAPKKNETEAETDSTLDLDSEVREPVLSKSDSPTLPVGPSGKTLEAQGALLHVMVLTDNRQPVDRQSVVKLYSEANKTTTWQTTTDKSEVDFAGLPFGKYAIEVNVVGYLSTHKEVEIVNVVDPLPVEIVLQRDPSVADLGSAEPLVSPHATKEMKRAINALKSANLQKAEKDLAAAYKLVPSNATVNFLIGYLCFQKGDFEQSEAHLTQAAKANPHYGQALTLLGRVQLLRGHPDQARTTLELAVTTEPADWRAHNLLADAYLDQHDYEKAQQQARLAIDKGNGAGTAALLVLGEALAGLGRPQDAIQDLRTFLQDEPQSPAAPQAQQLIATLEKLSPGVKSGSANPAGTSSSPTRADALLAATAPALPKRVWEPPGIDSTKPAVASGVVCPYERVIAESGMRVQQLVDDVARFAAVEGLLHERLDEMGNPTSRETRKFDYAASITETHGRGGLKVDEYRTERYGVDDLPDHIADNGFAALALVFHPAQRGDFNMACEGLSDWHGRAVWLIRFQQRSDRPSRIQGYQVGGMSYLVNMKGRAWITADKFQIVRIESEMVSPLPEIQLLSEHQITEYGPVPFAKGRLELWLPKSAEVYLHYRGRRYYRRHDFEKYMLFSVDTDQQDRNAKHEPEGPASTSPRKIKHWPA